jgi:hypothetical protein
MAQSVELGYSASIALNLHVGGRVLSLARVGPDRIVLTRPAPVPAGHAELEIKIGGSTRRQAVEIDASDASTTGEIRYR